MVDLLFDNYLTVFGALVILLAFGAVVGAVGWRMRRRVKALERELAGVPHLDSKELYELLQSAVAHELLDGLEDISGKSRTTLEDLPKDQLALRDKQNKIIAKAQELIQHAENIMHLYALPQESLRPELLNIAHLTASVVVELYDFYAENKAVTVRPSLEDIGPVLLSKELTLWSLTNVIHNAIKYSNSGGVVEVTLSMSNEGPQDKPGKWIWVDSNKGPRDRPGKWIWIDVKDTGIGIKEEDRGKIFELRKRADGLVEPGHGLGLYLAREAARRQGGDVTLAPSKINEGSTFRIILPYSASEVAA
jgi:signal transduction histidine kinase